MLIDNLSAVGRRPVNAVEEPLVFVTRSKIEAKKIEHASVSSICLDLTPPYAAEVTTKMYPVG